MTDLSDVDPSYAHVRRRILDRSIQCDRGHESPCWISDRAAYPKGYTKFGLNGRTWLTHRLAYVVFVGPIPDDYQIDHLCRQTACCNPEHLEPVTARENLLRGDTLTAREAAQTHCKWGHPLVEGNLYRRADRPTARVCLTCHRRRVKRFG